MTSFIYWKFRAQKAYTTTTFDGSFISVGEAKRLIANKANIDPEDLVLTPAQGAAEYKDDGELIAKGSSIVARRVPKGSQHGQRALVGATPLPGGAQAAAASADKPAQPQQQAQGQGAPSSAVEDEFGSDPALEQAAALRAQEEAARLAAAASAGQQRVDPAGRGGAGRGTGVPGRGGLGGGKARPYPLYICPRCNAQGRHWESECPTLGDPTYDVKRVRIPAGIPKGKLTANADGDYVLPNGTLGQITTNSAAFQALQAQMLGTAVQQQQQALPGKELLAIEAGPAPAGTQAPATPPHVSPQQASQPSQPQTLPRVSPAPRSPAPPSPLPGPSPAAAQAAQAQPPSQPKPTAPTPTSPSGTNQAAGPSTAAQPAAAPSQPKPAAAAPSPALFDDDDDVLQAAAQQVKLAAVPAPAPAKPALSGPPASQPPKPAEPSPEELLRAKIKQEREQIPAELKRPIFASSSEFVNQMPLLMSYNLLPRAPVLALVRAFAAGPLTPTEWQQLLDEQRAPGTKADSGATGTTTGNRGEGRARSGARSSRDGGSERRSERGRDREERRERSRRSRSRSRSPQGHTGSQAVKASTARDSGLHTERDKSEVSDGGVAGAGASDADLPAQSSKGSGLVEQSGAANGTSNVSSAPSQDSDSDSGSPRAKRRRSDSREPRKKHKRDKKSHAKKSKSSKGRDRSKERDERKKDKKKSAKDSKADRRRSRDSSDSSESDGSASRSRSRSASPVRRSGDGGPRAGTRNQVPEPGPASRRVPIPAPAAAARLTRGAADTKVEERPARLLSKALSSALGRNMSAARTVQRGRMGADTESDEEEEAPSGKGDGKWKHDKFEGQGGGIIKALKRRAL